MRFRLDHRFATRHLSAYASGDLGAPARRRVSRHLRECDDCGRAQRSLRRVADGLQLLAGRRVPGLADRAIERFRAAHPPSEDAARR